MRARAHTHTPKGEKALEGGREGQGLQASSEFAALAGASLFSQCNNDRTKNDHDESGNSYGVIMTSDHGTLASTPFSR